MEKIQLSIKHKDDLLDLYRICFEYDFDQPHHEFFFNEEEAYAYTEGWLDQGRVVSAYTSFPVTVKIRGQKLEGKMVDGVTTLPGYRNRGLVRRSIEDDITESAKKGIPALWLDPFKFSYYRKFGFETAIGKHKLTLDWQLLSTDYTCPDYSVKMGYLSKSPQLQSDYSLLRDRFMENSSYNEFKFPPLWEKRKFQQKKYLIAVVYQPDDTPGGYMIYELKDNRVKIQYFRYRDLMSFYALKKYILSHTDQDSQLIFEKVPADFPLDLFVDNYWQGTKEFEFRMRSCRMMRILRPVELLQSLIEENPARDLYFLLNDDILKDNKGLFVISRTGKVEKISKKTAPDFTIEIKDLAPLATGRYSARQLYHQGKIKLPGQKNVTYGETSEPEIIKILNKILPPEVTFSADEW